MLQLLVTTYLPSSMGCSCVLLTSAGPDCFSINSNQWRNIDFLICFQPLWFNN